MFFRQQRTATLRADVPTARDINPTDGGDLDERTALKSFLGRDAQEALERWRGMF